MRTNKIYIKFHGHKKERKYANDEVPACLPTRVNMSVKERRKRRQNRKRKKEKKMYINI